MEGLGGDLYDDYDIGLLFYVNINYPPSPPPGLRPDRAGACPLPKGEGKSFEEAPKRIGFAYEKSCAEALESRWPAAICRAGTAEGVPMPERIDFLQ